MQQLLHLRQRFMWETRGPSLLILGREVTPISRITRLAWPGGGLLIHRPRGVEVGQGGTTAWYRMPNAIRRTLILLLLNLVGVALALGVRRWLVLERNAS
jgi:hypothetical protein